MSDRMKVKIRVGSHTGQIFEARYKWDDVNSRGVTIPELNDEFFSAGTYKTMRDCDKTGNCLDAEFENLWAPYYTEDNGDEEILIGDNVLFVSDKVIKYGRVDKIIPSGFTGGIGTRTKITIREFETNYPYTYQHLDGIVKMENVNKILQKFKSANP